MKGNEGGTSQAANNVIGGVGGGGAKKKRKGGNSSSSASVFEQMVGKLPSLTPESLLLPHRVWKVKFVGKLYFKSISSSNCQTGSPLGLK